MTGLKLRMFGRAGGEKSSLAAHAPIGDVPTAIPPSKPLDKNFRRFICVALPSLALNFSTPPMRHLTPLGNHSYFVAKLTPRQVKLVSARPEEAKLQAPCPRDNCFLNSTLDQRARAIGKSDKMSLSAPPTTPSVRGERPITEFLPPSALWRRRAAGPGLLPNGNRPHQCDIAGGIAEIDGVIAARDLPAI